MSKPKDTRRNNPIPVNIEGERSFGKDIVLLEHHDNLIKDTGWHDQGYTVAPFLESSAAFVQLQEGLKQIFRKGILNAGVSIASDFPVEEYHHLVQEDQDLHLRIMNYTKHLQIGAFPIDVQQVVNRLSDLIGVKLKAHNPHTNEQVFHLRIVRPNRTDFNPLHRDVWLDFYRGCVNIYVPVAGSTEASSLPLVPGSHLWAESEVERTLQGAIMNGAKYNVPGLTGSRQELNLIRPNPQFNEVLLFSPYLIHGGAANLNQDQTRVSLEMRFWRA